jgi:hypothetical protein
MTVPTLAKKSICPQARHRHPETRYAGNRSLVSASINISIAAAAL